MRPRLLPLRLLCWVSLITIALLGCPEDSPSDDDTGIPSDDDAGDDDSAATDDDSADDDGWGDPGAQDPPALDDLPDLTNESQLDITGTADEPGSLIRAYGIEVYEADADATTGDFAVTVGVAPGPNTFSVTAQLDGLESLPATATTERCSPDDANEPLGGDSCHDAIDLGALLDTGAQIQFSGNALEEGDEDWYVFTAADDVAADLAAAADDWSVSIAFLQNDVDEFAFEVYRGSCDALECPEAEEPVLEYTSTLDQTPCGTAPYNDCVDDTTPFYIRVYPLTDDSRCRRYKIAIRNG